MTDPKNTSTTSKDNSQSVSTETKSQSQPVGRPTVITDEVVAKLVQCFEDGSTITEACRTAQINKATYFRRIEADQEFSDKMAHAQEYPDAVAKMVVVRAIKKGDTETGKWWLENHVRDEFYKKKNTDLTSQGKILKGLVQVETANENKTITVADDSTT